MPTYNANNDRDRVKVELRLDKVVLSIEQDDGAQAQALLTAGDARAIAGLLEDAAASGERTPGA